MYFLVLIYKCIYSFCIIGIQRCLFMAEQVFPTKGNLIKSQKNACLCNLGYELMDRKRNILIREMMTLMDKAKVSQDSIEDTYKEAYAALQGANITLGVTFTTLVLFGGALFAAFPLFYSVSFGGAYAVWMAILFSFTLQAVSYEYRKKENNFLGAKTYEAFMFANGTVGTVLVVAAIAVFSGSLFYVDSYNLSTWESPLKGLRRRLYRLIYLWRLRSFFDPYQMRRLIL